MVMKVIILLLFVMLNTYPSFAAIYTAASCENKSGQTDIQTAVNSSTDGDVVIVPSGSCTISTQVNVTNKRITIQGAGIDQTTLTANITSGTRPGIFKVTTKPARITGFTFTGTAPTYGGHIVIESLPAPDGTAETLFRVDHCKFSVNSGYAMLLGWASKTYGLIDNNQFSTTTDHSFIDAYGDNRTSWSEPSSLGTYKAIYVEGNTFTNTDAENAQYRPITGDGGARIVFRNNTVTNQSFDAHGYCGNGLAGTFSYEIYNNSWSIQAGRTMYRWMFLRSGTGVVYNNVMTNSGTLTRQIDLTEYRVGGANSCTGAANSLCTVYPCLDQVGRGTDQVLDPLYIWNNTIGGVSATTSVNAVTDSAWITKTAYGATTATMFTVPTVANGYYYQATSAGTSGASEPTWPTTVGGTVIDNTVTWTNVGAIMSISSVIGSGMDYVEGTIKPGYVPYIYPHLLNTEYYTAKLSGATLAGGRVVGE